MNLIHMTIKKIILLFWMLFVGLGLSAQSYAAAWLQPKETLLTILNNQAYNSCTFWNRQGQLQSGPS